MVFWKKVLKELKESNQSMEDLYHIIMSNFKDRIYAEQIIDGLLETMTYEKLDQQARKIAYTLKQNYHKQNDTFIGIYMQNSPLWAAAFWGILMAGFSPLLLNTRSSKEEVFLVLRASGTKTIISDNEEFGTHIHTFLGHETLESVTWNDRFALYTSGTTGEPKICLYNGKSISAQVSMTKDILRKNKTIIKTNINEIKVISLLPFYHIFGFITNLMWFTFFGRTLVFIDNLDSKHIQYIVKRLKVTHFFAIPLVWHEIAKKIRLEAKNQSEEVSEKLEKGLNFSLGIQSKFGRFGRMIVTRMFKEVRSKIFGESPIFLVSGGSHIDHDTLKVINGLGYPLYNGYGMTETGIISVELSMNAKERVKGSVGMPFRYLTYKIDEKGILNMKGIALFNGYIKDQKVYERNQDEWFLTNDLFYEDKKTKKLYMQMRMDDVIIGDNGENINPQLIEYQFSIPFVENISVFGLKKQKNDEIAILLQLRHGITMTEEKLALDVFYKKNEQLAFQEQVKKVFITYEALPMVNMKVQRKKIIDLIQNKHQAFHEVKKETLSSNKTLYGKHAHEILEKVRQLFRQALNDDEKTVLDTSHFMFDLNGNSIEYFSLINLLTETFKMDFNIADTYLATPNQFVTYILNKNGIGENDEEN